MNKINIVLDFNYLAHSEFSIFTGYSKNPVNPLGTKQKEIAFIQGLASKFFYAVNSLPKGGKVVVCIDSKSWRKSVFEDYKKSREDAAGNKQMMDKDTKEKFYSLMSEFGALLQSAGIIMSRVPGAEGDDLMYRWADYFYGNGESCVLITGDRDLNQSVQGIDPWVITWNNNSKYNRIYAPEGWKDTWLKNRPSTIFEFEMSSDKDDLSKLVRDNGISIERADRDEVVMHKILIGDDGDDVPAVWSFVTKNKKGEDKSVRVTEKKAEAIMNNLKDTYKLTDATLMSKWDDPSFMEYLSGLILRVIGDVDGTDERRRVQENLKRNAQLVWLSDRTIPVNMITAMDEHITAMLQTVEPVRKKWNRNGILQDSRFEMRSGIAAGIDPMMGMELPE